MKDNNINTAANDFRNAAEELKIKTFAESISTDVDNFVEQHFNKPIEKNELEEFFNNLLDKCVKSEIVSEKAREEYKKPKDNIGNKLKGFLGKEKEASEFEKIVQATAELLKDTTPNLSFKDKLFYNVAQFCEDLGLKSLGKICKKQISSDNQVKLDKIYTALASGVEKTTNEVGKQAVGKHTAAIIEKRKHSEPEKSR